jgi:hypothetical protein
MKAVIDRVVQYPNRFKLTDVSTGTVLGTFDLDAVTGTISVVGTKINKELFDSIASDIEARVKTSGGDVSQTSEIFTASSVRNNLTSGETISVSMGKIYKWLNDLKALAFKDNLSKEDVGLDKVDNTSDKEKPISDLTQAALDKKQNSIPLITLAASQAISPNPIKIQLTDEQYAILSDNFLIILDATALGMTDKLIFQKNYNGMDALSFSESIIQYSKAPMASNAVSAESVVVDSSTKIATLITQDLFTGHYVNYLLDEGMQMMTSADNSLQANITAEANIRSSNDAALQTNIDNEANARSNADTTERSTAKDEYVKNMLHLGYYDTYTKDSNGNYIVTRQTGYIRFTAETATDLGFFKQTYSNITRYAKDTTWTELISNADFSSDIGNTTPTKNGCFLSGDRIYVYAKNNDFSGLVIYIQGKTSDSYTETYEPSHFARIEPYALEHAKSEADRSSNLTKVNSSSGVSSVILSSSLQSGQYTLSLSCGTDDAFTILSGSTAIGTHTAGTASFSLTFTISSVSSISISGTAGSYAYSNIMLNRGSVAIPYQPYEGKVVHESGLTKSAVGLSNVDNTSDLDKPVSTAVQTALNGKQNNLTIDATLSETSTNAVQNGVVTKAIKKAQGTTIKVLGNASDFFDVFFLDHYTSPVHSTVIKFELKNAVSLSLQSTYGFAKPILTKAVLVKYGSDFEHRYPLVISGFSKRSSDYTCSDSDDYEMFSISEMLYNSLSVASDITGTADWYFLFTFEEME